MYQQEIIHKIIFEIKDNYPTIKIGVRFNDMFTKDTYVLVLEEKKIFDKNNLSFFLTKNNEKIKKNFLLTNLNCVSFLNEIFGSIEDNDFLNLFTDDLKTEIEEELKDYFVQYEKQIVLNEIGLPGEMRRMKELSGLKNKNL